MGILSEVDRYYSDKIITHGPVPGGVDWNSQESQMLRFDQLLKLLPIPAKKFSILDFGCGYGSLFNYMKPRYQEFQYAGFDISRAMIDEARRLLNGEPIKLSTELSILDAPEYTIASGIFNVKQKANVENWMTYVEETLTQINKLSSKGFSFNMLTSYSDEDHKKDYLYYADPCQVFDFCKRQFSKEVALLHDYNLYEFTVLVRK